jgi:hypothetical protein
VIHRRNEWIRKELHSPKGGTMLRIVDKGIVAAAKYFKEEVLEIMPDIPQQELSDMVAEYVYYQQVNAGRDETHAAAEETCA